MVMWMPLCGALCVISAFAGMCVCVCVLRGVSFEASLTKTPAPHLLCLLACGYWNSPGGDGCWQRSKSHLCF